MRLDKRCGRSPVMSPQYVSAYALHAKPGFARGDEHRTKGDCMPRSMWRGAIQCGLVTVPVKPYLATEARGGLSFNLLHKTCMNRIQMKVHCPEHGEIPRSDTVRGFEYSKGQY